MGMAVFTAICCWQGGGHNLDFGLFNGKKLSKSQTREPDLPLLMTAYAHDSFRIAKFYARQQIQIYRFFYSNAHCAVRILPFTMENTLDLKIRTGADPQ